MENSLLYAGFWKRFQASLLDSLIYLPLTIFSLYFMNSKSIQLLMIIPELMYKEVYIALESNYPIWKTPIQYLYYIWLCSEFIVILFNEKKRAIYDFIAGTVVIDNSNSN